MNFDFDDEPVEAPHKEIPPPAPKKKDEPPPEKEKRGSLKRFYDRILKFKEDGRPWPLARHHALWVLHNCVSHPWLAVHPSGPALEFHELTSQWLGKRPAMTLQTLWGMTTFHERTLAFEPPAIERGKRVAWFVHNAIAHPLIGVLPTAWAFRVHDHTAERMGVPRWV